MTAARKTTAKASKAATKPVAKKAATKKVAASKPATKAVKSAPKKPAAKRGDQRATGTAAPRTRKVLLDKKGIAAAIDGLAKGILAEFPTPAGLVILGIRTRGVLLADRIRERLEAHYGAPVANGVLDITFYRDDLSRLGPIPQVHGSELPFDITDTAIVLVDDVLYTGRTARAALDEISDFGRPALVRLVVLVDRGLRELPLQADYCALRVETKPGERVMLHLEEIDDEDSVKLAATST